MKKIIFLPLLLCSHFASSELVNRTLAIVGKELILQSDVEDLIKSAGEPRPSFSAAFDALIEKSLLLSECKKYDFYPTETEIKQQINDIKKQYNLDDKGLIRALGGDDTADGGAKTLAAYETQLHFEICRNKIVQNKIRNRVNITPDDVERASQNGQINLRSLFVKIPTQTASIKSATKTQMLAILQRLKGGASFEDIMADETQNNSNLSIVDFGMVSKSVLVPEIAAVVYADSSEKIRGPVETDDGFHLFEVLERVEGKGKPLVDEQKDLHKQLFEKEIERLLKQFIEEARASTYVDIMGSAKS